MMHRIGTRRLLGGFRTGELDERIPVNPAIRRIASATSSMLNRADCNFFLLAKNPF